MTYTNEQLELIARHLNAYVKQDDDGNVVWNNNEHAETGWRPIYKQQCEQAIASQPIEYPMDDDYHVQPEQADLPHRDWICEECGVANSCLDAECQYCDGAG